MSNKFEDRLAHAIDEIMHYQTDDNCRINTTELAATLITLGVVADPVQHQQDLVAIMDKQVRDSEGWSDEFVTTDEHPILLMPEDRQLFTSPEPRWGDEDQTTYHRRVTEWREVHRA